MMIGKISFLFKNMDKMIFEQIDSFKNSPAYDEIWDKLESLSGGQGKTVFQILSVMVVLLPFMITTIFWWGNSSLKDSLDARREITKIIHDYKLKNAIAVPLKSAGTSAVPLKSKEDFTRILNISSGQKESVKIKKIKSKKISKNLGRSRVLLSFQNLTTGALMSMLKNAYSRHKARVSNINIKKDKVLKTLNGEMELIFYSAGVPKGKKKNGK